MRADKLREDERLAHVVVGAAVQTGDTLFGRRLGTEDESRKLGLLRSDVPEHLESGAARKHEVEHDTVVVNDVG
jgi:hypothetical protein